MKILNTIVILLMTNLSFGQKDLIGLFGNCDNDFSGYICQQVLFNDDSTFHFYDLLHLRGWTISKGKWQKRGDTVLLNSTDQRPFTITYKGNSSSDSLTIYLKVDKGPLPFANVTIKKNQFSTDTSGTIRYPRQSFETLYISFVTAYRGPIKVNKEKVLNSDTLEIKMKLNYSGKYYFDNQLWLLKGKKLYHTKNKDGEFDKEKYFTKTKMSDLKYSKDY